MTNQIQIRFSESSDPANVKASSIQIKEVFQFGTQIYMRVKPVSYLLNSTVIQDNLAAGKIMVVNLVTGGLNFIPGFNEVTRMSSHLHISKLYPNAGLHSPAATRNGI